MGSEMCIRDRPPGTGAILAIASSKPTVAANNDGSISVKKIMQVNLTADHRVIYGADGFFFQAEDGIRDVERSRGLGDVYKRQI